MQSKTDGGSDGRARMRSALLAITSMVALTGAMLAGSAPAGAAVSEQRYSASFQPTCDFAPGVLDYVTTTQVVLSTSLPSTLEPRQSFAMQGTTLAVTLPVGLVNTLEALNATRIVVTLKRIEMRATNITPGSFALPGGGEEGISAESTLEKEKQATITVPSTGALSSPSLTVTGEAGQTATLGVAQATGFVEAAEGEGPATRATGAGLIFEVSAYDSSGAKTLGPVELACDTPATELAGWTIESIAPPPSAIVSTYNLPATGAIEDSALSQSIPLPEGTTLSGSAAYPLNLAFPGYFNGEVHVPAFSGTLKLFGLIPIGLGLRIENVTPFTGSPTLVSGEQWSVSAAGAYSISIDSVSLLSLKIPTSCRSERPLASSTTFTTVEGEALGDSLNARFPAALTPFKCEGGLLGRLFGSVLTHLLSGTLQVSVT